MEDLKQLKVVDGKRAFEGLRERMTQIDAPSACGIGVVNNIHQMSLIKPEFFISKGKQLYDPASHVENGMASMSLFLNNDEGGSSGCLCYTIGTSDNMFAILWVVGSQGNRFNVRCLPARPCDEKLFSELYEHSIRSSESILRDENGYRLQACMTDTSKSILIVECSTLISTLFFSKGKNYYPGPEVGRECEKIVKEFKGHNCCTVGIENAMKWNHVGHPQILEETGKVLLEPVPVVEPGMGTLSLFCKREFALKGTSGCLSYDIGDSMLMAAVKWQIPPGETESENKFNVIITARKELGKELSKEMEGDWVSVRQGKISREQGGFFVEATITEDEKAVLYVKIGSRP